MANLILGQSYLRKASGRLDILNLLLGKGAFSDVMKEGQEIDEIARKIGKMAGT